MACVLIDRDRGESLVQAGVPQIGYSRYQDEPGRRCADCGYVFFPPPATELLDDYYNTDYPSLVDDWYYYESDHAEAKTTFCSQRVIDIAARFGIGEHAAFHEIGCSFGGIVRELNRRGVSATGTELNRRAVLEGQARGNHAIFPEETTAFLRRSGHRPNVVYGFHVFEHMSDPVGLLSKLRDCLAPDAIVIMFIPNAMALYPSVFGFQSYIWFNFPAHINLFSAGSAPCLAHRTGYELLDVTSMRCFFHPEATEHALLPLAGVPVADFIRNHLVAQGLMEEELVLILTPRGSDVARRHEADIAAAAARCRASRGFEASLRALGQSSPLGGFVDNAKPLPPTDATEFAQLRHRAEQAELALQAIRQSTCWRATAWPRRVVDAVRGSRRVRS